MLVTLIYNGKLYSMTLPDKIEGQFWFEIDKKKIISIDAIDSNWYLVSNKKSYVIDDDNNKIKSIELVHHNLNRIKIDDIIAIIFTEPITLDRQKYYRKNISNDVIITIGKSNDNVIVYQNDLVSESHANLIYHNKYWQIKDNNSANKTYVNGVSVVEKNLDFGDVIYIMGLKIVVMNDFIMLNNPDNHVKIKNGVFDADKDNIYDGDSLEEEELLDLEQNRKYFYRSPRFKKDIKTRKIKVDDVTPIENGEKLPIVLTLGPSITMGLVSGTTAIYSISNAISKGDIQSQIPSIVMSLSMLLGTLIWPMCTKFYEKKRRSKKECLRALKYNEYLSDIQNKIDEEIKHQTSILKENYISIDECEDRILKLKRNLWERSLGQDDFLQIRLGNGNLPLNIDLIHSENKFSINQDELQNKMYELCDAKYKLMNVPITISLFDKYVTGVIGSKKDVFELAQGLIFEIASLYSYDEVKMIFLYDSSDTNIFQFVKWLPHAFSDDRKFRFIATNINEAKEISYYLDGEITKRIESNDNEFEGVYYVVFALDKKLSLKAEFLNSIYKAKKNIHFSVINFFEHLEELPKECMTVVELNSKQSKIYDKNNIAGDYTEFKVDINLTASPETLSKKLANIYLNNNISNKTLPNLVKFLDMFEVGKIEHLNVLSRWNNNDPVKSLATPVGVDEYGELFNLDLHEKFHGPHGLVAGMTGSGKSEFIMTYILSLAINYHPDEVAFILIDYKGGGMAKSFEKLPHVAGIITNLDGSAIKRTMVSINSELKRRQSLFDSTRKKVGISNIDIYKYQKLYRDKKVKEPVPHLFIISDEFAELKSQQPEFMSELVSAARIGRSLGVHLILATQKPSGVVDDQIWSNSRFRVCLKVQEKADSQDMLKRPDAAYLKETGRFYMQVGFNELFSLGQSAWSGAPYYPHDKYTKERDDSVVIIDKNARVIKEAKFDKDRALYGNALKQLDAITSYLNNVAAKEKIKVRPVWLKPLAPDILLSDIESRYNILYDKFDINPLIGEFDDPTAQAQSYLRVPISKNGNLLIYGSPSSGKSIFITTFIYSIIKNYSSDEVNMYVLDFEAETLKAFDNAPQIGDIILSFENEKVINLFKMIYKTIDERKKLFAEYGGNYKSYLSDSNKTIPNIIVIINNYAAFLESYSNQEDVLSFLTREGVRYGIYFVIACNGTNEIKYKIAQNFGQIMTLQFNDESNYQMVLGKTGGIIPANFEGRGLTKIDKKIYEFQTAKVSLSSNPYKVIKIECDSLKKSGTGASKVKILPNKITIDMLKPYKKDELSIPIGMEKNSLNISYYNIYKHYINMVISESNNYHEFLTNLANMINTEYQDFDLTVIDELGSVSNLDYNIKHVVGVNDTNNIIDELYDLILKRNNTYKEALESNSRCPEFAPKIFIIDSIKSLFENKDNTKTEKLELALMKGITKYNVYFIIFDELKNLNIFTAKEWYKAHVRMQDGVWIGDGLGSQYLFKINNLMDIKKISSTEDFGFVIQNNQATLVKFLNTLGDDSRE